MNQVIIHGIGHQGEGVGLLDGYTLFVEGALPGETVDVVITEKHKRFGRGKLVRIQHPSQDRIDPPCPLFGSCGGCQLMHLSYTKQLENKRQRVVDALTRIGKCTNVTVNPCIASPDSLRYRNKIQMPAKQIGGKIALGLYANSSHDLIEISECLIHNPVGEEVYHHLKNLINTVGLQAYDLKTEKGELRHVLIKSSLSNREALVILIASTPPSPATKRLAHALQANCSLVKGVVHNLNTAQGNVILGEKYTLLEGQEYIYETLLGMTFKVSPASFFQVNPCQAEQLYAKVLEFASLSGTETILDAYCGVGTLSLMLAKHAKAVIGIECVQEAIEDAEENARLNGITNASFLCGATEHVIHQIPHVDIVVLNPPRKGCEPIVLEQIGKILPKQILYVSCDPATLARDLQTLMPYGYYIEAVQPFDMFPQTAHVETCVSLRLKA